MSEAIAIVQGDAGHPVNKWWTRKEYLEKRWLRRRKGTRGR
jgi:hypothetical protein